MPRPGRVMPRTRRDRPRRDALGAAYRSCDNGRMDSELPVVSESPFGGANSSAAIPARRPADRGTSRTPRRSAVRQDPPALCASARAALWLAWRRSRPSSRPTSRAGPCSWATLKFLTTGATALVSVAAYSLFWGWQFAAGFVALLFVHEMGHVIQLQTRGDQGEHAHVHPLPGRRDLLALARRQCASPRRGWAWPARYWARLALWGWRSPGRSPAATYCWRSPISLSS